MFYRQLISISALFMTRTSLQELLITLSEHMSSPPGFSGVRVTRSLVLRLFFSFSLLVILLSVLRLTDSDYPFAIFKHF